MFVCFVAITVTQHLCLSGIRKVMIFLMVEDLVFASTSTVANIFGGIVGIEMCGVEQ